MQHLQQTQQYQGTDDTTQYAKYALVLSGCRSVWAKQATLLPPGRLLSWVYWSKYT